MDIKTIIAYMDDESTYQSNWSNVIQTGFAFSSIDYLSFAAHELQTERPQAAINAIILIKRALRCHIHQLLRLFGYKHSKVHWLGYRAQVRLVESYGIVVPEKLSGVNQARNLVEHLFSNCAKPKVQVHYEDVAAFIDETKFFTMQFPPIVEYSNHIKQEEFGFYSLSFFINQGEQRIYVNNGDEKVTIKGDNPMYIEVFKRHLRMTKYYLVGSAEPHGGTNAYNSESSIEE